MSSIPNSATPEAVAEDEREGETRTFATRAADLVREHPRTAIAAGAIAAAGVAAAIPLARRGRSRANGGHAPTTGSGTATTRTPAWRAKKKG